MLINLETFLNVRNSIDAHGVPIFYLVDDTGSRLGDLLTSLIDFQQESDVQDDYRIACIYHAFGHMTPILIEKVSKNASVEYRDESEDYEESEEYTESDESEVSEKEAEDFIIRVYCTDARALDVQNSEYLRNTLLSLPDLDHSIELYAVGLDPALLEQKQQTIRQHSDGVCGIYSLIDLELMLRVTNIYEYLNFEDGILNLNTVDGEQLHNQRTFQITKLPPAMMLYTQSIYGDEKEHRLGLAQYIEHHPEYASAEFTLVSPNMSFADLYSAKGYLYLLSSLSSETHIKRCQHREVDDTYKELHHLSEGKTITLKELCAWHEKQLQYASKQRALMIDMFVAMVQAIYAECSSKEELSVTLLEEYNLENLMQEEALMGYLEHYVDFVDEFHKDVCKNTADAVAQDVDKVDSSCESSEDSSNKFMQRSLLRLTPLTNLNESEFNQFATEVISRTPDRKRTPLYSSQDRSPVHDVQFSPDLSSPSRSQVQAGNQSFVFTALPPLVLADNRQSFFSSHENELLGNALTSSHTHTKV